MHTHSPHRVHITCTCSHTHVYVYTYSTVHRYRTSSFLGRIAFHCLPVTMVVYKPRSCRDTCEFSRSVGALPSHIPHWYGCVASPLTCSHLLEGARREWYVFLHYLRLCCGLNVHVHVVGFSWTSFLVSGGWPLPQGFPSIPYSTTWMFAWLGSALFSNMYVYAVHTNSPCNPEVCVHACACVVLCHCGDVTGGSVCVCRHVR